MFKISVPDIISQQDIYNILKIFFAQDNANEVSVACKASKAAGINCVLIKVTVNGMVMTEEITYEAAGKGRFSGIKWETRRALFRILSKITGTVPPWGILAGVRPAKIVHLLLAEGRDKKSLLSFLTGSLYMSVEKAFLAYETAVAEKKVLDSTDENTVSIYIGIPFCPSRCLYCSFTSWTAGRYAGYIPGYMEALRKEMEFGAEILEEKGWKAGCIYIGGGTPTALDSGQLKALLESVSECYDILGVDEFTVEAGRPDSISKEKLAVISKYGAGRISINPQSMNDETLKLIGRDHSALDVVRAFEMARNTGFKNINMDVIAGLPAETAGMFEHTMEEITALKPESITVHALSLKRASRMYQKSSGFLHRPGDNAGKMISAAAEYLKKAGMRPYYLYRQKNILGNLENTGYCRPGCEGVYNIQIMADRQTIIAQGAGAVSKAVSGQDIKRAFNVKNIEEYIARVDEMIDRKKKLFDMI